MSTRTEKRLFLTWLLLSAVTLLMGLLGTERGAVVTHAALLIAAFKVRVIVVEFMEAGQTSKFLQHGLDAWLSLLVAGLIGIYALVLP